MKIVFADAETLGEGLDYSPITVHGNTEFYPLTSPVEIPGRFCDADIIIINKFKMNREALAEAKKLKLICIAATGYDNIDTRYCEQRGIAVCNVPGYSSEGVSQLTLAMALSLTLRLPEYAAITSSGEYTLRGVANDLRYPFRETAGKTWGIIGPGNIGSAVKRGAEGLNMKVITHRAHPKGEAGEVGLEQLMAQSDVISIHLPLNDSTRGIVSREMISLMKPTSIIINVSRGAVWDEVAVAQALSEGKIAALGADVYSKEPFGENDPFWPIKDRPNVILTPHIGWGAVETRQRCMDIIGENIGAFIDGGKLNRVV